jgi:hypothetical protein
MAHEQKISQANPGLIEMIVDDSGSMGDNLPGTSDPKCKWVELYFGMILQLLLKRSTADGPHGSVVKPRYYLTVIKYGSNVELWGDPVMDIEAAVRRFTSSGDSLGLGGHLGGTDALAALEQGWKRLQDALRGEKFRASFPPMVFHLTDGMSHTDASQVAEQIKQLSTNDGNVLMVNAYVGTETGLNYKGPEDFPGYVDVAEAGPSEDNVRLFNMSSQAPECIQANLKADDILPRLRTGSRLFFDVRTKEMLKNVIQVIGSAGSRMAR